MSSEVRFAKCEHPRLNVYSSARRLSNQDRNGVGYGGDNEWVRKQRRKALLTCPREQTWDTKSQL